MTSWHSQEQRSSLQTSRPPLTRIKKRGPPPLEQPAVLTQASADVPKRSVNVSTLIAIQYHSQLVCTLARMLVLNFSHVLGLSWHRNQEYMMLTGYVLHYRRHPRNVQNCKLHIGLSKKAMSCSFSMQVKER